MCKVGVCVCVVCVWARMTTHSESHFGYSEEARNSVWHMCGGVIGWCMCVSYVCVAW